MTPEERKKLTSFLLLSLAGAVLLVSAVIGLLLWHATKQPVSGGDFTLNYQGQDWTFSSHAKDLNLLYIGYTKCPDVCPLTLSHAGEAFERLSAENKKDLQLIFVSVDSEHETPEEVAAYARQFNPDFIGLTGTKTALDQAVGLFHASYIVEKEPGSYLGYSIAHTDRLFFLDQKGHVIDVIQNPRSSDLILQKIKENL